jgi:hypothetical protein
MKRKMWIEVSAIFLEHFMLASIISIHHPDGSGSRSIGDECNVFSVW